MWKTGRPIKKFLVRSAVIVAVIALRLVTRGFGQQMIVNNIWLVVGWVVGYWLTDIDDLFYVYVCNPQELTCQRVKTLAGGGDVRRAWELLTSTRPERLKLPVHNILTGLAVAIAGVWVISSSGSVLASGVVLGLSVRLFIGLLLEKDFGKWYWVFARKFGEAENRAVIAVWGLLEAAQIVMLVR